MTSRGPALRLVTDTNVGLDPAGPAARLSRVYAAVAGRAPGFVLHCGDITDTGLPGEYDRYQQAVVLGDGTALLTTERGVVSRVRLADGGTVWQVSLEVRVQNAGLAVAGDSAWVLSEGGRLVRVRLADGREQGSVRLTSAGCYCAPAVVGDTLIAGDQDGLVHGIRLPPGPEAVNR